MSSVSLQQVLVSSYLQEFVVKKVIGHDMRKYWEIVVKYLFLIGVIFWCALFFDLFESISDVLLKWIYSVLVLVIYVWCFYELLDTYLDTLVVTDMWLILFQWSNPFSQTTSVIQWVAIESIEHSHSWFRASLLNLGNITFHVEDQRYTFKRITNPSKTIQQILKAKERATKQHTYENQVLPTPPQLPTWWDKETYNIFVEALGEVMEEYLKKKW